VSSPAIKAMKTLPAMSRSSTSLPGASAATIIASSRLRGRLRSSYGESESLRHRIFGAGDRLPDRHYGARYRGGAHLPASSPAHSSAKDTP